MKNLICLLYLLSSFSIAAEFQENKHLTYKIEKAFHYIKNFYEEKKDYINSFFKSTFKESETIASNKKEHSNLLATQIKQYEERLNNLTEDDYKNANQAPLITDKIKFCIVTASYNNEKYAKANLNSLFIQKYHNWKLLYFNDASTDKTLEIVENMKKNGNFSNEKFQIISNQSRLNSASAVFYKAAHYYCDENDVMVTLDGDDMLYGDEVLTKLAKIYKDNNIWITFGTYVQNDGSIVIDARQDNIEAYLQNVRANPWKASHLRSYYTWLFKKIKLENLMYKGNFVEAANDQATMFPMLEMAGPKRAKFVDDILYIYRRHSNNIDAESENKIIYEPKTINNIALNNSKINIKSYSSPIPKVIHRIWMIFNPDNPGIPERYQEADRILKALHPDWEFIEWDDKKILSFVHEYYPDFYERFVSYEEPIMRHDTARYLILKHFGGVFIQHSFVFQKNISPLLGNYKLVFSTKLDPVKLNLPDRAGELNNNIMASVPQHPFWDLLISNLKTVSYSATFKKDKVMSLTGPFILTDTLKEYQAKHNDKSIHVLHYKYLMPFYAFEKDTPIIKENCIEAKNLNQCFSIFPEAFAYTTWEGSWSRKNSEAQTKALNLKIYGKGSSNITEEKNTSQTPSITKGRQKQLELEGYIRKLPKYSTLPEDFSPPKAKYNCLSIKSLYEENMPDQVYVINLDQAQERWGNIHRLLECAGIKHIRFPATNGYNIKITDLGNNQVFYGSDIKNKNNELKEGNLYKITCNPNERTPIEFKFKGYIHITKNFVSAGELGLWCSTYKVWQDAKKNNYKNILIFDDDIIPISNFKYELRNFISSLPKNFDLAYLYYKLGTPEDKIVKINKYVSKFDDQASGWSSIAILFSQSSINTLLSQEVFTFPIDHFYWHLITGIAFVDHQSYKPIKVTNPLKAYASSKKLVEVQDLDDSYSIRNMGRKL